MGEITCRWLATYSEMNAGQKIVDALLEAKPDVRGLIRAGLPKANFEQNMARWMKSIGCEVVDSNSVANENVTLYRFQFVPPISIGREALRIKIKTKIDAAMREAGYHKSQDTSLSYAAGGKYELTVYLWK